MEIQFLYFEDCPSHEKALARLNALLAEEGLTPNITITQVETEAAAEQWSFVGSPTIRVNGEDIAPPSADEPFMLACRIYRHEDGRISPLPSEATIRHALQRAKANV